MGSELDFGVVFGMGECTEFVFGSFPEMCVGDCVPLQPWKMACVVDSMGVLVADIWVVAEWNDLS